jgi:hypothetical protein
MGIRKHMSLLTKLTDLPEGHDELWADFEKRFHNTYMVYKTADTEKVLQFVDRKNASIYMYDPITDRNIEISIHNPDIDLIPLLPKKGYYNHATGTIFISIWPQRQWKRSLCSGLYHITRHPHEINKREWGKIANIFLKPEYPSLDDITSPLFANIALSKQLCLRTTELKGTTIYYYNQEIGVADFERNNLFLPSKIMKQEVMDYLNKRRVKNWTLI